MEFKENHAYWCMTEEIAEALLKEANSQKYFWGSGNSYAGRINYDKYGGDTCYVIREGTYCSKTYFDNHIEYEVVEVNENMLEKFREAEENRRELREEKELEAKTEANMKVVSSFMDHYESETGNKIPEEILLSFFNA